MTQSEFLKYILDHDCFVYQQTLNYYKLRKKGTRGSLNMSGLPIGDPDRHLYPEMICQICKNLGIESPDECKPAMTILESIWQWIIRHLLKEN